MTRRRWLTLGGILAIAFVLAFPLRDVIREMIIIPIAYFWWVLGILYQSLPENAIWIVLVFIVILSLLRSLIAIQFRRPKKKLKLQPPQGQVEDLAKSLARVKKGNYYKWLIANRLGRLARDFLVLRGDRASINDHTPLTGRGWRPSKDVDKYLDVGLRGSFSHFPSPRFRFLPSDSTPLDTDVDEVLGFLEKQIKTNSK